MADSWEDDFESDNHTKPAVKASWEEEENEEEALKSGGGVKASWEDDEEEEVLAKASNGSTPVAAAVSTKKKRTVAQAIKERQQSSESIHKSPKADNNNEEEQPVESEAERKMRLLKLQQEADLENAADLFSICDSSKTKDKVSSIELTTYKPKTKLEYEKYSKALCQQLLNAHMDNKLYPGFVDTLIRDLVGPLSFTDVRSLSSMLNVVANEKQKAAKDNKGKKKVAVKKAVLKTENNELENFGNANYDDFDDFM